MLSAEQADLELRKYAAPEAERRRGVCVRKRLAPPLAARIAGALADRRLAWSDLASELDGLSTQKRAKVLSALCPSLGADLSVWWEWSRSAPYQRGWDRRAYRSGNPRDSLAGRWEELVQLLNHGTWYPQPLSWHASWLLYLGSYVPLGGLLAAAVDAGNTEIKRILLDSVRGRHPIGGPSQQAFVALLACTSSDCWEAVEDLLVSAQRAEGLRQTILEASDLGHPDAFARMLAVIGQHDLVRFAGTVRAMGVWLGEELEVRQPLAQAIATLQMYLRRPPAAEELLEADPATAYLGLWAHAVRDANAAAAVAAWVLNSPDGGHRLAAARLLTDLALPEASEHLALALEDESLPVFAAAVAAWPVSVWGKETSTDLHPRVREELQRRVGQLGRQQDVQTGILGSRTQKVSAALAADVIVAYSPARAVDLRIVEAASTDGRQIAVGRYAREPDVNRKVLFSFLTDRSSTVRGLAANALEGLPTITSEEAVGLEKMLTRKAADLRTAALLLLRKQDAASLAGSIGRLSAGVPEQQRAARELEGLLGTGAESGSSDDVPAEVRFMPEERTQAARPVARPAHVWKKYHRGVALAWTSLGAWLDEHADVEVQTYSGVELLANLRWIPNAADGSMPLASLIDPWWERTQGHLTDGGVEVALLHWMGSSNRPWVRGVNNAVVGPIGDWDRPDNLNRLRAQLIGHVARREWRPSWAGPLLDMLETAAAALPADGLMGAPEIMAKRGRKIERDDWGNIIGTDDRVTTFGGLFRGAPDVVDPTDLTDDQLARLWRAVRFLDEPEGTFDRWHGPMLEVAVTQSYGQVQDSRILVPDQPERLTPEPLIIVEAFERGIASEADLIDSLIMAPRRATYIRHFGGRGRDAVWTLTALNPPSWVARERTQTIVEKVRRAAIAQEADRGDLPTRLSETSKALRSAYGADSLIRVLAALGKRPFARGYAWTDTRESGLSHLVRIHQPRQSDTADELGRLAKQARITNARLIETAVYAPQWAQLIEEHLGWTGLESAVWWVHAHTKDDSWSVDQEIRAQWASEVSQRTPLDSTDLVRGAADVAWYRDVVSTLGPQRFATILKAAKYASSAGGHKRAELFASALIGDADEPSLMTRIQDKRHQDSVRAVGLLPLSPQGGDGVLYRRYETLRGFVASDRTSGSQRRASESTAVEVGLENLARTAGYRDPQRLIWAMEAAAVRDLAEGPVVAAGGDLVVSLQIDDAGVPLIEVKRAGKPLKTLPAKSAKLPEIAAIADRAKDLRKQARRMRTSLEASCVLGDTFDVDEVSRLLQHPILAPMLREVVLVDVEGIAGYPSSESPGTLLAPDGTGRQARGELRIAHPLDLLESGEWPDFQHAVMTRERPQPFKQVFRELYTLNTTERDERGAGSRRYAGHQLEARRAGGIFTSRGWVADFETGFSRTFHQEKLTVWCHLLNGWGSPTDVEDATITDVTFHPAGSWQPMPLEDVPRRLFSEAMRDLDLVVSVAHASGVDPEVSESSVEMRTRLVDETATLLGLSNVEVGGHHARIKGTLGTYSIHLGSGVVHRSPGNAVCIVPVSAQHRGRIFLPFADDDPRTAEIVAKVVLLARDDKIKDPTILEQLVR